MINQQKEIENLRKRKLGLTRQDTRLILETIMLCYKNKVVKEPRTVMGYTVDIVFTNMSGFNKLGKIETLYEKWGDKFFIDFNSSTFCKDEVDEDGNIFCDSLEYFKNISELKQIKNISFSLKEMIELCKKRNVKIKIIASKDLDSTIEIVPYEIFDSSEKSINTYLKEIN